MVSLLPETTSSHMGNGSISSEKRLDHEADGHGAIYSRNHQPGGLHHLKNPSDLVFFAGTDKARVITEILEGRGWSRTKDHNVTNFTIKWCLAHQVDWSQFQEGKQLINNIPGQLAFSDKINLWYTIKDYLHHRRSSDGNHIQTFLPMTFVLDNENEVAEFIRSYKKQSRTWICKPRYSFAGRGIYVISANSDLNAIFKFKTGVGNRLQHQPRVPGYLMQEYIARPLLIKGRKFDIRVHWLVAWTKPLLVFYNHNASVVRLSLNLYREFDFDRATHLTNLSVQEHHYRYALSQEATGMTMQQLNHYFNQCFRPFHSKMCQDWVMTIMQERMQTIIRHVIRASKEKLTRGAGQFGLFGCDFLLDENFRIWLLEINDNPGVGWGNSRLNTTTKPLFEETLNIVFECLDKYTSGHPLLPIECLKNYQLIYNEDDDVSTLLRDDNQMLTDRLAIRYSFREPSSRTPVQRLLPRVSTARTIAYTPIHSNTDILLPLVNIPSDILPSMPVTPSSSSLARPISVSPPLEPSADEPIEPLKHCDDLEFERVIQPKPVKCTTAFSSSSRPVVKTRKSSIKRGQSTSSSLMIQRKRRIDLTPMIFDNRRYVSRQTIIPKCTETSPKPLNRVILEGNIKAEPSHRASTAKIEDQSMILSSVNLNLSEVSSAV